MLFVVHKYRHAIPRWFFDKYVDEGERGVWERYVTDERAMDPPRDGHRVWDTWLLENDGDCSLYEDF